MTPVARHHLIRRILAEGPIASQDEHRRALASRGVEVTQGTLSRDLRTIGVVKTALGYALPGDGAASLAPPTPPPPETALATAIRNHVVAADTAGNLVVLRTAPGHAQPVALAIDVDGGRTLPGVVGTVAGDDTIFIAVGAPKRADGLATRLRSWAGLTIPSRKRAS